MSRPNDVSNVPRWVRLPIGLMAAAIAGPAVLGMIGFIAAVLAPFGIIVLPFILWGLSRSGTGEAAPHRITLPTERARPPILQPT